MKTWQTTQDWWRRTAEPPIAPTPQKDARVDHEIATPFWALVGFTFVLILAPQDHFSFLKPLHLAFLFAVVSAITVLINRVIQRRALLEGNREYTFAGALAAWALVMVPLSYWPSGSASTLFTIYFKALVVFWLLGTVVDTVPRLRLLMSCLTLIAIPLALSAVETFFNGGFQHEAASHGLDRIAGYKAALTGNPNDLAVMINLLLPLSIALFFCAKRVMIRVLLLGVIALDMIAVIATYSRGGFLTLGVIVLAYTLTLLNRGRRGLAMAAAVAVIACLPFLPSSYVHRLATITHIQEDQTGSSQARWRDVVAASRFVMTHPLVGTGAGMNYLALNDMRGDKWVKVHDVYLEYAMDLGWLGLLLFLLLMRETFKSARTARLAAARGYAHPDLYYMAEGIRVSLLAFAVAALFYPDAYQFYFYYIAGLAVAGKTIAKKAIAAANTAGDAQGERPEGRESDDSSYA